MACGSARKGFAMEIIMGPRSVAQIMQVILWYIVRLGGKMAMQCGLKLADEEIYPHFPLRIV